MVSYALSLLCLAVFASGKKYFESSGEGEDVRRAIPGEPGRDYPTLAAVPTTSFACVRQGFFADPETRCQVFHMCSVQRGVMGHQSFLCPNGTVFNALVNTCDWWNKVHCDSSQPQHSAHNIDSPEQRYTGQITERRNHPGTNYNPSYTTGFRSDVFVQSTEKNKGFRREPLANSISTERYTQSTVKPLRKVVGTKENPETLSDSRVPEVTIKPRVRYTYNLKASDNPLYSLNPLIHLARDSSLLSTFTKSADASIKVTHPVERYVVDGVLPQYNYSKEAHSPDLPDAGSGGDNPTDTDDKENPIVFPDSLIPSLDDVGNSFGSGGTLEVEDPDLTESNGNTKGFSDTDFTNDKKPDTLTPPGRKEPNYNYPQTVRVTGGYKFSPSDDLDVNTPKTVKVTTSYSIEDSFSTEGPDVNNTSIITGLYTNPDDPRRFPTVQSESGTGGNQYSYNNGVGNNDGQKDVMNFNVGPSENGSFGYNYETPNDYNTEMEFINRFVVNEPGALLTTNSYNLNSFGSLVHTTPTTTANPDANYLPSSSPLENNFFSGTPDRINGQPVTQQPLNEFNNFPSKSGYNENNVNTTPNPIKMSYNNIPGHYITRKPQEVIKATISSSKSQTYNGNLQYGNQNHLNQNYFVPSSTTELPSTTSQENNRNFLSTPGIQVTNNYRVSAGLPPNLGFPLSSTSGRSELVGVRDGFVSTEQKYELPGNVPQYLGYSQIPNQNTENGNVLTTEKSVEIKNVKEMENIFSGLKIDKVSPSVEAYSWSSVTPSKGEALQTNSDFQNSPTTPLPPSHSYGKDLTPSTETYSKGSNVFSPQNDKTFYSTSPSFSLNSNQRENYSTKTTATYINNDEEVNLYSVPKVQQIFYGTQRLSSDFSPEPNFSTQQSPPNYKTFTSTNTLPYHGSSIPSSDSNASPGLTYSTPKPFTDGPGLHLTPTLSPEYKEEGRLLLDPAELLKINSLPSSIQSKTRTSIDSAELIKSISFSFDDAADIEQFELAKTKGLFLR